MSGDGSQRTPRPRPLVPEERRRRIAQRIKEDGSVTVSKLEGELNVSPMTIRRDLELLEQEGKARRTHGGAVLPGYASHEDSFQSRLEENVEVKDRLARRVLSEIAIGETIFVDSSTTSYYAARLMLINSTNITMLSNLVPIMDLFHLNEAPNVDFIGLGGVLRKLTLSFVGPQTVRMIGQYFADKAILSVKGVTPDGYLTDPDPLEAEVKRAMIEHSREPVLLVDQAKFEAQGLSVIAHVSQLHAIITDAPEERAHHLQQMGVTVQRV